MPKQSVREHKNCAREGIYTDKQSGPVFCKIVKKQSLPRTPTLFKPL